MALYKYNFRIGDGMYTIMNAIRKDEETDNLHSVYVDQWDWEKVIDENTRNADYLKATVRAIVGAICDTLDDLKVKFPQIDTVLKREVSFITTQELEDMFPNLSGKERENAIAREHRAVFIKKIGGTLASGEKHDGRAPDYDDWELNGDIILWNDVLNSAFEISSMGIRVDEESMDRQLKAAGEDKRREFDYHKAILNRELPYTIGGGIGQSRLCMYFLKKAHIGEVQVSVWPDDMLEKCRENGINIL